MTPTQSLDAHAALGQPLDQVAQVIEVAGKAEQVIQRRPRCVSLPKALRMGESERMMGRND